MKEGAVASGIRMCAPMSCQSEALSLVASHETNDDRTSGEKNKSTDMPVTAIRSMFWHRIARRWLFNVSGLGAIATGSFDERVVQTPGHDDLGEQGRKLQVLAADRRSQMNLACRMN